MQNKGVDFKLSIERLLLKRYMRYKNMKLTKERLHYMYMCMPFLKIMTSFKREIELQRKVTFYVYDFL